MQVRRWRPATCCCSCTPIRRSRQGPRARSRPPFEHAAAGAFRIRFDHPRPVAELVVNARSRLFKVVYGDQALFASRAAFERVGGYRPIPIMEDRDLARRLRRSGGLALVPLRVTTSGRRHRRDGGLRTAARGWLIQLLYALGVPPERLARRYPPVR